VNADIFNAPLFFQILNTKSSSHCTQSYITSYPITSEFVLHYNRLPQRCGRHVNSCDVSTLQWKKGKINFPLWLIKRCDRKVRGTIYAFQLDIMASGRIHVLAGSTVWKERQLLFEWGPSELQALSELI
jgi:hypothetical protein